MENNKLHTLILPLDFKLINEINRIDKFGGSWSIIEKRESRTLKQLKMIATVQSVGASTRIEGSKMTNEEIAALLKNVKIEKLEERDKQEVVGYFNALDIISESYRDIDITENHIKNLHKILMKHSAKDQYHKGNYKTTPNSVEKDDNGIKTTIFETAAPCIETEDAMRSLIDWYRNDKETPALIKCAVFVYEFLSIHPFQDGNGRLSRLLGTLLLLKHDYTWIQYISFEHEIENRKLQYYQVLMECQQQRPGENVYPWVMFFLSCMDNIQAKLDRKLNDQKDTAALSPRQKMIFDFIESHPGCQSGEIAEKLNLSAPTVKRILAEMVDAKYLVRYGVGKATNYTIEKTTSIETNKTIILKTAEPVKEITLNNKYSFIDIKQIILTPLFQWKHPDEWSKKLINEGIVIMISTTNNRGVLVKQTYSIAAQNNGSYFEPSFKLPSPIQVPVSIWGDTPNANEYPLNVKIEISGPVKVFSFDVMLVYDGAIE